MARAKKKKDFRPASKAFPAPAPSLPPRILEEAAQGWLHSSNAGTPAPQPAPPTSDHRLAKALAETLQELRMEIAGLRSRIDRLETR